MKVWSKMPINLPEWEGGGKVKWGAFSCRTGRTTWAYSWLGRRAFRVFEVCSVAVFILLSLCKLAWTKHVMSAQEFLAVFASLPVFSQQQSGAPKKDIRFSWCPGHSSMFTRKPIEVRVMTRIRLSWTNFWSAFIVKNNVNKAPFGVKDKNRRWIKFFQSYFYWLQNYNIKN